MVKIVTRWIRLATVMGMESMTRPKPPTEPIHSTQTPMAMGFKTMLISTHLIQIVIPMETDLMIVQKRPWEAIH